MKLAEALQERADLNRTIKRLENRLENSVLVQEGETNAEDPAQLKAELDAAIERLCYLMERINVTNAQTIVDGESLTSIIARRDALTVKIDAYKTAVAAASRTTYRARGSEIRIVPTISIKAWQKDIDAIGKELRLIDNKLQENNWLVQLVE